MARRFAWLDVFASGPLAGNPLAVVHDADDLDDATMLAFAREAGLSETSFIQAADRDGADYRNRIWMTTGELDFAGHPSLGAAVAVALARGQRDARYVQQTRAGLQPIDVELADDGIAHASMLQEPLALGAQLDREIVAAALAIDGDDLDAELEPRVASTGVAHVIVVLRSARALRAARPSAAALAALLEPHGAITAYLAVCEPDRERALARGLFVGLDGVREDPATGSAAGPLCAYLHQRAGVSRLEVDQGGQVGRPSLIHCEAAERVRVGGDVRVVADGMVHI